MPRDPLVTDHQFNKVKTSLKMVALAEDRIKAGECNEALSLLQKAENLFETHSNFYRVFGDYYECIQEDEKARELWKKALSLNPAYLKRFFYLSKKLSLNQ